MKDYVEEGGTSEGRKPHVKEEKKGLRAGRKEYMKEGRKQGLYIGRTDG
jgi:hypothetical protein